MKSEDRDRSNPATGSFEITPGQPDPVQAAEEMTDGFVHQDALGSTSLWSGGSGGPTEFPVGPLTSLSTVSTNVAMGGPTGIPVEPLTALNTMSPAGAAPSPSDPVPGDGFRWPASSQTSAATTEQVGSPTGRDTARSEASAVGTPVLSAEQQMVAAASEPSDPTLTLGPIS